MTHVQIPLAEMQVGDQLAHIVRIKKVTLIPGKNKPFLSFTIGDKSGNTFPAKKWGEGKSGATPEDVIKYQNFKVALVTGEKQTYNNKEDFLLKSIAEIADDFSKDLVKELLGNETEGEMGSADHDGLFEEITKEAANFVAHIQQQKPLRELSKNDSVDHMMQVKNFTLRKATKKESYYFDIAANDQSKEMIVKRFRANKDSRIPDGIVAIHVKGKVDDYQDRGVLSILADEIKLIVDATEMDTVPLWPASTFPLKDLKLGLWSLLQKVENKALRDICVAFLQDPTYKEVFSLVPAATGNHHNHKSGLCEHLYTASSMAKEAGQLYNNISLKGNTIKLNLDSIVACMFYHDALKVEEYYPIGNYKPEGNLLKHIERGIAYVAKKGVVLKSPQKIVDTLCHVISAHHGKLEWGSFSEMACPEAVFVHHLDDWCSKLDPTIRELNYLQKDEMFTKEQVKALKTIAYRGTVSFDEAKYGQAREILLANDYNSKTIYTLIKDCLSRIKDEKLRQVCQNLLERHEKEFVAAKGFDYYSGGLPEFALRLMLFLEGMVYIWNKNTWPLNKVYLDTDVIVAAGFLIALFKIRMDHPVLDDIAYAFAEIGAESERVGLPAAITDLVMHAVRSQVSRDDIKFCAPESIFVHYIYRLLLLLDKMLLELSSSDQEIVDSRLLGRKIFRGLCEVNS